MTNGKDNILIIVLIRTILNLLYISYSILDEVEKCVEKIKILFQNKLFQKLIGFNIIYLCWTIADMKLLLLFNSLFLGFNKSPCYFSHFSY